MSTTNLFVELVVIGVGAALWVVLLLLALSGLRAAEVLALVQLETAVPLLALVYVLGIVVDRLADVVFERLWVSQLRQEHFASLGEYYDARRTILTHSERLTELLEYGRSRLRICRGWCLNCVLIVPALNLWLLSGKGARPLGLDPGLGALAGTLAFLLLGAGTWFAWRNLARMEYRKVREQARYLQSKPLTDSGDGP